MAKQKGNEKQFTRRDFIKAGGAALASMAFLNAIGCTKATTITETAASTATKTSTVTATATSTATITSTATTTTTATTTATETLVVRPTTHVITDMAGRHVTLPTTISRIATIGSVGVLNGFIFAMGQADKMVTGLPPRFDVPSWKYQYVVAPNIKDLPKVQGSDDAPNVEELLKASPEIVFTMSLPTVTQMENANLATVYLSWTQPEDVKQCITLLGEIFGEDERAKAYIQYFNETLARIKAITDAIPDNDRVRCFYGTLSGLSNPHSISEWWIEAAGGVSVTKDIHTSESVTVHSEDMMIWNPQVIFLSAPNEFSVAETDIRFTQLEAIKNKRYYIVPKGVHVWGNRNIEQPLTVLWAGAKLYPQAFKDVDIYAEVKNFYARFFDTVITSDQVDEILSGDITSF